MINRERNFLISQPVRIGWIEIIKSDRLGKDRNTVSIQRNKLNG
ncbi:Uncharacterised protein [Vibrio cholerae]|nr:Uncharacterised protein [Vibrio cholerae]